MCKTGSARRQSRVRVSGAQIEDVRVGQRKEVEGGAVATGAQQRMRGSPGPFHRQRANLVQGPRKGLEHLPLAPLAVEGEVVNRTRRLGSRQQPREWYRRNEHLVTAFVRALGSQAAELVVLWIEAEGRRLARADGGLRERARAVLGQPALVHLLRLDAQARPSVLAIQRIRVASVNRVVRGQVEIEPTSTVPKDLVDEAPILACLRGERGARWREVPPPNGRRKLRAASAKTHVPLGRMLDQLGEEAFHVGVGFGRARVEPRAVLVLGAVGDELASVAAMTLTAAIGRHILEVSVRPLQPQRPR